MTVKIASAQYEISFLENWANYRSKINRWVEDAARENARILLFPEYASMELASVFEKDIYSSLNRQLHAMQALLDDYLDLFVDLAKSHGIYIVSGSFPVKIETGAFRNRAYLFSPDGKIDFQEKIQMTRFEDEHWIIEGGSEIKVFNTDYGILGINICYDSEFPHFARKQAEMGAGLILVPSCTDTVAGFNRVRIGCQARALENQCYVVQSPTVGMAEWSESIDVNVGAAGVFTPVDREFPDDGVLAAGALNAAQWVFAEIDFRKIETVRKQGQVLNYRDWSRQFIVDGNSDCLGSAE
ncbi:MAG: carbon-nitrogen hydrolase family protein [Gammaproteobacteria bacterium]